MSKKDEIIEIAKKHFAKNGYDATSLEDVAKELKITKPALYYHFKSKNEIYNEIFKRTFLKLKLNEVKSIKDYVYTLAEFFEKDKEIATLFSKELSIEAKNLNEESLKIISKTLQTLKKVLPSNVNPLFIQTIIISSLTTYLNTYNLRNKIMNITEIDTKLESIKEELYQMVECYLKGKK